MSAGYGFHSRRFLELSDFLRLQGFQADLVRPRTISARQMAGMIGNSWSIPTVCHLAHRVLWSVGLTDIRPSDIDSDAESDVSDDISFGT